MIYLFICHYFILIIFVCLFYMFTIQEALYINIFNGQGSSTKLNLLEGSIEAAPQLMLQLSILFVEAEKECKYFLVFNFCL